MTSRLSRGVLCLVTALSLSNALYLGYGPPGPGTGAPVEYQAETRTGPDVIGGQAIDWVTCVVSGAGAYFFPFMGIFAAASCYSAVVKTWG